jgi:hypothetical protein
MGSCILRSELHPTGADVRLNWICILAAHTGVAASEHGSSRSSCQRRWAESDGLCAG